MKECKYSKILPCYTDGYGVWHYLDDTHDKVYGVNKQMCDIGKTMNDPMKPLSEESVQEIARVLEITRKPKDIMEEKKTIEEWKETFVELYKAMRKDLGASDLDVYVYQNNGKPKVNFDVKF